MRAALWPQGLRMEAEEGRRVVAVRVHLNDNKRHVSPWSVAT